ncbi:MAG: peptide chain release factor N(5)-glutamine methyltransferase [Clostridia bacterium]|nr:peptide chain release factor N(5)-glutamine methyltransferase [Clostridia bacterium]
MGMMVKDIINIATRRLEDAGVPDAKNDAEILYCHMRNIDRAKFFMEWPFNLEDELCDNYFALLDLRAEGKPLQYITGKQNFMGFDLLVDENVLIPRQDTEVLVAEAIAVINNGKSERFKRNTEMKVEPRKHWKILDLCTGSGAIAVAIGRLCANVEITASDISHAALEVAKKNVERHGLSKKVELAEGDLFTPFKKRFGKPRFDMIISNPPYIRSGEIPNLQREVKDFEPLTALDGGADGLDFYRKIIAEAPEYLKKNGVLMFEIGFDQAEDVVRLLDEAPPYTDVGVMKDLAGNYRVIITRV